MALQFNDWIKSGQVILLPPFFPPTSPVSMWEFPGSSSAIQKGSSGNRDSRTRVGGNTKHPAGYYKKPCYGPSWTCLYCRLRIMGNVTGIHKCAECGVTLRWIFVAQRSYNKGYYVLGHVLYNLYWWPWWGHVCSNEHVYSCARNGQMQWDRISVVIQPPLRNV